MKIKPLKQYPTPAYPTRDILHRCPELLRLVPARWRKSMVVLAAVGVVAGLLLATRKTPHNSRVAPLFLHGDGAYQATFGCIAVTPPVFLSEDEARYVIVEEAKKAGISLRPTTRRITAQIPGTNPHQVMLYTSGGAKQLEIDGNDKTRHIYYEYISTDDYNQWKKHPLISPRMIHGSAYPYSYRMCDAAQSLQRTLSQTEGTDYIATFYDPVVNKDDVPGINAYARVEYGEVVIPLEKLADSLGIKVEERWEKPHYKIFAGKMVLHMNRDSSRIMVNGHPVQLVYWSNRYSRFGPDVPLFQFCSLIGATQTINPANHTITVTYPPTGKTVVVSVGGPLASKEALRQQVRDFIGWLKTQGAI
jgi:hypothetical protein